MLNANHFPGSNRSQPALIILHGLFGSSSNWRSIARRLSQYSDVYTLDLRNHGASFWDDEMDYPTMAEDVAEFISETKLATVNLIGHSMGGKTAMTLALSQPDLIQRLLIVDIAPVTYQHSHAPFIDALLELDLTAIENRKQADQALQEAIPETGVRQFLLQNLVQQDGGFSWRVNLTVLRDRMPDLIGFPEFSASFDRPTLFLYGEHSDYVIPAYHATIKQYFPQAELQAVNGAGHWLQAEQPNLMIKAAQQFFDAV